MRVYETAGIDVASVHAQAAVYIGRVTYTRDVQAVPGAFQFAGAVTEEMNQ